MIGVFRFLFLIALVSTVVAEVYRCFLENDASTGEEHCVFRNVRYSTTTRDISFEAPSGSALPPRVTFENSSLMHLPDEFLQTFADKLKVLKVEGCMLRSITIIYNMEALYARGNYITEVKIYQDRSNSLIRELDLSANRLKDLRGISSCKNLEVLNLSSNEALAEESTIDLSTFAIFKQLRELYLSDVGAFYLENNDFKLPNLQVLDLSRNSLIPSDLRVDSLSQLKALKVLKLNDNNMAELDYGLLPDLNSLTTVYLNGNNFRCDTLRTMLKFLHERNIETPAELYSGCQSHQQEVDGMCCADHMVIPPKPIPSYPTPSIPIYTHGTDRPTDIIPIDNEIDDNATSVAQKVDDIWLWSTVAFAITLAIIVAAAGFVLYRKRQNAR
ncbi:leucine-rich repeat-containing G-protein coupled receptor 4-like [Wyeomyia smithii]|uniref:leucine-rich repeat-containing G-protein coupled receptor 4-like n=1 Tax=Wyeomyia smithii TaxID=174621 RepID=UPI002467C110|nr:leucine-rich repeat-containing G-protein coupled receptor 4-like [Wyeomyia smithii]